VESEIFRDADAPKGSVDVNAEDGVIYLRGEVDDEQTIERLVGAARGVEGVRDVRSLLHTPGTPAPTKS
jgi:osmotically-inducible protein OsmY